MVDPGDGDVVLDALRRRGLELAVILITHHHPDHIGGLPRLLEAYPGVPVYGPRAEAQKIPGLTRLLDDGDRVELPELDAAFEVLAVPGHTLGHIAYHEPRARLLFCGDTLFAAGCGRLFEGSPQQMHASLSRLATLPGETAVYCAHEYTLSNLAFARAAEPGSAVLAAETARVESLRAAGTSQRPQQHRPRARRQSFPALRRARPGRRRRRPRRTGAGRPCGSVRRPAELEGRLSGLAGRRRAC